MDKIKKENIPEQENVAEECADREAVREEQPEQEPAENLPETGTQEREHHHHSGHHHSRHHRGSHKRRHSHRNGKKMSTRKLRRFFKKYKKILIPVAVALLSVVVVVGLLGAVDLISKNEKPGGSQITQGTEGIVILAVPVFEEEQSLVGKAVDTILENEDYDAPAHVILENYLETSARLDVGAPVKLNFYLANKPTDYTVEKFTVEVAEQHSFENAREYTLDAQAQNLDLLNLKTGTQYFFRINAHFTNGVVSSAGSSFRTKASPRILTVSGAYNVRDIGGWKTADGKTVRQGLLLRGTELDGAVESKYTLTEAGRTVLLDHLGVRTEMDLRWTAKQPNSPEALGGEVQHLYYGIAPYTDIFVEENQEEIRRVFSDLAKPENYPVYIHCTYGRDRTGTVCCLLEALLGMQEGDLWRDYQLSALDEKYLDSSFDRFMVALKNMEGQTMQEKAEHYLASIGVTEEEIDAIQAIFLG